MVLLGVAGRFQSQADKALIPHLAWAVMGLSGLMGGGLYHIKTCGYVDGDNLMDLTHETYRHASSIGQKKLMRFARFTTVEGWLWFGPVDLWKNIMAPAVLAGSASRQWIGLMSCAGWSWQDVCFLLRLLTVMIDVGVRTCWKWRLMPPAA